MVTMKGLILAGGLGTRLRPTTYIYNKHLIHVYDRPMIMYPIETLKKSGITDIIVSLSYDKPELFMDFLKDGSELGVKLTYVIHGKPLGIAYAINHAKHLINDKFLAILGDNFFGESLAKYVQYFQKADLDALILVKKMKEPQRYGVLELDGKGKIKRLIEKPEKPPTQLAVLGAYFLSPKFFDVYPKLKPSKRGEYEITEAINLLLPKVEYKVYRGKWFDLGTPEDILQCANWVKAHYERPNYNSA
jgi:glucose-1-phosphate thymidylyltransferase